MARASKSGKRTTLMAGVVLVAVALIPRLYGLSIDFVDIVEFLTMIQPPDSGVFDYLASLWAVGPDQVPVYYIFTWAVRNIFGYSWLVTRFASLVLMLSVLLLAWRTVSLRFGAWAGFLTGVLLALSPADIYYAIQARSYSLVIFEAAISIWTLVKALETGKRRWLVLNVAINTLLPWTHLFGFLLIAAEGLWLLGIWYGARPADEPLPRRVWQSTWRGALWGAGHALAIALALYWILTDTSDTVNWYAPAPWSQLMTDLLGDAQYFHNLFVYESTAGQPVFNFSANAIHNSTDYWLAFGSDLMVGLGVVAALASAAWATRTMNRQQKQVTALLFMAALVPPIFLYLGAALTIPVALPRYTAYCNFPLYMLLGIGLAAIPTRKLAWPMITGLLAALIALCTFWSRVHPEVDWPGAVALVKSQPDAKAPVMVLSLNAQSHSLATTIGRMMEFSDPTGRERYRHAYTISGTVDACAAACAESGRPIYVLTYAMPPSPQQEQAFTNELRAKDFRIKSHPHQYFRLYSVSHDRPPPTWQQKPNTNGQHMLTLLQPYLSDAQDQKVTEEQANAAMRWAVREDANLSSPAALSRITLALLEINPTLARACARYLAALSESSEIPPLETMLLALEAGDTATLHTSAAEIQGSFGLQSIRPVAAALATGTIAQAREIAATRRYVDGVQLPPVLLQLLGLDERLPYATPVGKLP